MINFLDKPQNTQCTVKMHSNLIDLTHTHLKLKWNNTPECKKTLVKKTIQRDTQANKTDQCMIKLL